MKFRTILITTFFLVSSCTTIPITPAVKLPPPLQLERVTLADFHCTTDDTFAHCQSFNVSRETLAKIIYNNRLMRARIDTLANIIIATQPTR